MLEKDPRDRLSALPTMWDHSFFDGMYVTFSLFVHFSPASILTIYVRQRLESRKGESRYPAVGPHHPVST